MSEQRYQYAKEAYQKLGVDTDQALEKLANIAISMHCWQGDDLCGFENADGPTGGIAATGNYPGKPRTAEEMMQDIRTAFSLIPGKHRLNMHAVYAIGEPGEKIERNKIEPRHFKPWVDFAKELGIGLDFNSTFFSHPMADDGLTLSHPDEKVREFWIEHAKACRKIAAYMGKELGTPCLHDIWIPDGYKDVPADRIGPRRRLKEALDEIYAQPYDKKEMLDCVEAKLFGIGLESFTVGSHEFYMNYTAHNPDILCLLDSGHFHPTEVISDKLSSLLLFADKIALHVTRGVRWDSDHVVLLDEELKEIAKEIVRCGTDRVLIGLDFFDASINRISAWVVGMRNMQKALLYALLMPNDTLTNMQDTRKFTQQMALQEELKTYPFGDVWDYFCETQGVPVGTDWIAAVEEYEKTELSKRV
jgi:L-rhamnose isomerase